MFTDARELESNAEVEDSNKKEEWLRKMEDEMDSLCI